MGGLERYRADASGGSDQSSFVSYADGRVVYFPFGSRGRGYVVPDGDIEAALWQANERLRALNKRFLRYVYILLAPVVLFGFSLLLGRPSLNAICLIIGPIAVAILLARAAFSWFVGGLVWGLERVRGDPKITLARWRSALAFAGGAALVWLTLHLYNARLEALKGDLGTFNFYPNLWRDIMFAIISALFLFGALSHFDSFVDRVGKTRARFGIAFLATLELTAVTTGIVAFFGSTPRVTITRDFLICGTPTRWSDVAAISLVDGRRGKEYAKISLKSANPPPPEQFVPLLSRQYDPAIDCEISDLETDYNEVYREIEMAWRQASSRSH